MVSLLALMAMQALPTPVRIDCLASGRVAARSGDARSVSILLDVRGNEIVSARVEGMRLLSSYLPGSQLRPAHAQWRGRFQGHSIRLRRAGGDMVLEPREGAQEFSGFWTVVEMVDHQRLEANGGLRCHIVAGTLSEGAHS